MDIIIGGGISGISYANFTRNPYMILERESETGGYCRTIVKEGFVWDYSGHFFHFRHPEIGAFVCRNIDPELLVETQKRTQIYYKGRYIDFPFQANIHQLDKEEFIDCLYDLYVADASKPSHSFKEFVYNNLGRSISDKFLIPYNEKLYATDLNRLDASAMGRFFPRADKDSIIRNFREKGNFSYNDRFTYPRTGAIEYIHSLSRNLDPQSIRLNSDVVAVNPDTRTVVLADGQEIHYDNLISTMPFPRLLEICGLEYDPGIYTGNKVLVFNLGFDQPGDNPNSWVYFPESEYVFYRVGFYNNIIPSNRMSLYVEIGFPSETEVVDIDSLRERVLADLKRAGIVTSHRLVAWSHVMMNPAYVHINNRHLEDIAIKKQILAKSHIYSIGRYGSWTYCSIEDNILEAQALARELNVPKSE